MKLSWIAMLTGGVLLHSLAFADVTYQETTQITGGSMTSMLKIAGAFSSQAKQLQVPQTSTVMIHEGRMVRTNIHSSEIIDLDARTMTMIDHDKRTYSVVTFQQLQDQMAKASAQMKSQQGSTNQQQMTFDAKISSNGQTRQIDGQTAKEALITITMLASANDANNTKAGMAATSEMWLVEDEPGLDEMKKFNERLSKELSMDTAGAGMMSLLGTQPGGQQALAELKKEAATLKGVPVLQVTRVGISADGQPLPAPSTAPLSQAQTHGSSTTGAVATEVATGTATQTADSQISKLGTFGRALGGSSMGALMRHAPANKPAPAATPTQADAQTAGVLVENQTQTSNFAQGSVDQASFQVPAGYKQIASPMDHK